MSTLTTAPFEVPEGLMRAVISAYAHPPRAYHSFAHVQDILRLFAEVAAGPGWRQPNEIFLAALFHDAVYDASLKDNEQRSALFAREAVATFLPKPQVDLERIVQLIEYTALHGQLTAADVDADAALFLDCDVAILGAAPAVFDAYNVAVAEEYRPHVPAIIYGFLRRRFLRKVLDADRIFLSDFFHARLDVPARENLRRALRD